MKDLIEALTIFGKYIEPDDNYPTHCEHDVMYVKGPPPEEMGTADASRLVQLSFEFKRHENMWFSYRFGSC